MFALKQPHEFYHANMNSMGTPVADEAAHVNLVHHQTLGSSKCNRKTLLKRSV